MTMIKRLLTRAWRRDQRLRSEEAVVERLTSSEQSWPAKAPQEMELVIHKFSNRASDGSDSVYVGSESDADADDEDEDDDGTKKFRAVMAQADFKQAAQLATRIRTRDANFLPSGALKHLGKLRFACKVVLTPADYGSYNILLPVRFRDRKEWLLKIPANGCFDRWNEQSVQALTSEVMTMKLLYNNSSVPVPRIYGFDATTTNALKCPYILMERVEGINLYHGWYYDMSSLSQARFREEAMVNVAKAIVQLNAFTFPKAGALQYNPAAKAFDIGPYRKVNNFRKDGDTNGYVQQGPFDDPRDYFLTSLDAYDTSNLVHTRQSQCKLLRIFINWFFQATSTSEDLSGFVLTHPDFNLQNMIMGKDGSLRGIVDWDGAVAVPRCIGCEEYPLWLSRDWDTSYSNGNLPIMLPAELDHYRALYAQSIDDAVAHKNSHGKPSLPQGHGELQQKTKSRSSVTRISCLARSLYIAANEPNALPYNVNMILEKIIHLTSGERFDHDNGVATHDDSAIDMRSQTYEDSAVFLVEHESASDAVDDDLEEGSPRTGAEDGYSTGSLQINKTIDPYFPGNNPKKGAVDFTSVKDDTPAALEDSTEDECPPADLCNRNNTIDGWLNHILVWTGRIIIFSLWLPAIFVVLMQWVHSWNTFPIGILFAGLLFSTSSLTVNLAIMQVVYLLVATVPGKEWTYRILRAAFLSPTTPLQTDCNRHPRPTSSTRMSLPASLPQKVVEKDGHINSRPCPEDSIPLQHHSSPSNNTGILCNTLTISRGCPGLGEQTCDNNSDSSGGSSRKSNETTITEPDVDYGSEEELSIRLRRRILGRRNGDIMLLPLEERLERIKKIWRDDPTYDFGDFSDRDIYNALHHGGLDASRMRQLKVGFQRLLASLDDRFADFDGLTLSSE